MSTSPRTLYIVFYDADHLSIPVVVADGSYDVTDEQIEAARNVAAESRELTNDPRTGFPSFEIHDEDGEFVAGG